MTDYAPATYTGNGSSTDFTFTFDYLDAEHVFVTLDGVDTSYELISQNTVRLSPAPGVDVAIVVYRDTPGDPLVVWADGAVILGRNLNDSSEQSLFIAEEARARAAATEGITTEDREATEAALAAAIAARDIALAAEASATAASSSAAASVVAAASSYDSFDDRFLGNHASDPTLDNDGNALVTGSLYFNTGIGKMKVYTGASWQLAFNDTSAASAIENDSTAPGTTVAAALSLLSSNKADSPLASYWRKVISGGSPTTLSGADDLSTSLTYDPGLESIFLNGVKLVRGVDYTATDGTTVTGLSALAASDVVEVISVNGVSAVGAVDISDISGLTAALAAKVETADIVDNLTTNDATKVLSAKQGKTLKDTADTLATTVSGKASSSHTHAQADVTNLVTDLAAKLAIASVVNDLTTGGTTVPLSAEMGKTLKTTADALATTVSGKAAISHTHAQADVTNLVTDLAAKVATADIVDNLTTNDATKPLSAKQGKTLKDTADTLATTVSGKAASSHTHAQADVTNLVTDLAAKVATASIVNDLTTGGTTVPLSAEQGKTLKTTADALATTVAGKVDTSAIIDTLVSTSSTVPLSAKQGKTLKDTADALATTVAGKVDTSAIIDTLTSTSSTVPLSAKQGKTLKDTADTLATTVAAKETLGEIIGLQTQTGTTYTLVLGDKGKTVEIANASAIVLTIPPNSSVAFPVDTYINVTQSGAGQITITPGAGVTLRNRNGLKLAGQWAMATLYQRATDEWVVGGDLTT